MARLNTRTSATPLHTRSSTVDSLYRNPSVAPRPQHNAGDSSYSVLSPSASISSDKENEQPETRQSTPRPQKPRGLRVSSARMPTPGSGATVSSNGSKRRRTDDYGMGDPAIREDSTQEDDAVDSGRSAEPHEDEQEQEQEQGDLRFYNPNQDPEQQRRLRATMRDHSRMVQENRDELIKPNDLLLKAIKKQDNYFGKVRQTADAALDSRFLVNASDLASKKLSNSLQGNAGVGIDLDQFVSKCIYFIKSKGHTVSDEEAPAVHPVDDDDRADDGLDWAFLGRQACFPCNKRPPTSSFLLGPLSVQKKVRTTQRKARSQRQPVGPATRPQEIKEGDIQESENSNMTKIVKGISARLREHLKSVDAKVADELNELEDDPDPEDLAAASRRHRGAISPTQELGVNLLDFAINPHDFGQTVENLFYISFLIREGNAQITKDEDGLPILMPAQPQNMAEQRENDVRKNQAVLSIDYPTWQMFVEAFDITEPLIPHRQPEEVNIGGGGWYAG